MNAPLHTLGMHANQLSRHTNNERMQGILQWVGVGSVIMMGLGATVSLFRDCTKSRHEWTPEPYPKHKYREMKDEIDESIERGEHRHRHR